MKKLKVMVKRIVRNKLLKNLLSSFFIVSILLFSFATTPTVMATTVGTAPVNLGRADDYTILTKSGISSVSYSVITGNIGVSPIAATAITGFSLEADDSNESSASSQITGMAYAADYASETSRNLTTAVSNMEAAYTDAAGRSANYTELYAGDISGKILTSGVYKWGTNVLINSDVTLCGGPNDVWIFQIAKGLTQASGTKIILKGGAQAKNIFWQTAETTAIGADAHCEGIILGMTNITLCANASINGRLLAQTAVTLIKNKVVAPFVKPWTPNMPIPIPSPVNLGRAVDYTILAKTGISSVPDSIITGNIGVGPIDATAITGFSLDQNRGNQCSTSNQVKANVYAANYGSKTPSNLTTAVSNMEAAYTDAAGRSANYTELYAGDISGKTLTTGVYKWGTNVLINSDVTLRGGPNDVWIFQIAKGLNQASGTKIILKGGAQAKNIFWQTAETTSIGADAHCEGIILGMTNITLCANASINGQLLAQTAVTLIKNKVTAP